MDNDAFIIHKDDNQDLLNIVEVRQCLDQAIEGIGKRTYGVIMDTNGNSVGSWKVTK